MLEISRESIDAKEIENEAYALKTLSNPKVARYLAYWLLFISGIFFICLFLPWQQNIEATGDVTALTPQDRPQEIHTAIAGRIIAWRVKEGQFVEKGDTLIVIAEIKDDYFDPQLLKRLDEQVEAKEMGIDATQRKIGALNNQIGALEQGLTYSLSKARNKYEQARLKIISDSTDFIAAKLNNEIGMIQYNRYDTLYQQGLVSRSDWEKRRLALQEYGAKLISVQNKYLVSKNELLNALIELSSLEAEYMDKISKSESDKSSAMGYMADAEGELSKIRNKLSNVEVRNTQHYILAPQDCYIVKALVSGLGETLKENEAVLMIMPAEPDPAVELYVRAMDVSLISVGRHVRLEFDGWPALQFSGWPSVSVGTFGGVVQVIDVIDSKEGKYRILVTPTEDEPWPEKLRVGSGVYGWVMLDDVSVWYEIWRQLNGFPPSLYEEPKEEVNGEEKKEKKSDKKIKIKVKR